MTIENQANMLTTRVESILYYAKPFLNNEHRAGWIGGNAPEFFDDQSELIHEGNQKYAFYLSLNHPFKPERMISIFIPEERHTYLENNIYPHCPIKVIEHPVSAESMRDSFTHKDLIKHSISHGERSKDEESMEQPFLIKVGGNPRLIQDEDYYFAELKKGALSFFFQVEEDGYPETLIREDGDYPFGYGSLYIFAKMGTELEHPVAGFCQFS
ncbi:hypothetical protein Q9R46_19670 [Paenibacillus sp. RRE4]|uniref:hypothetical protein n=1 Tax=Paenibacillus sp. RRE4 TaxID=2962587 RepID=UPI0028824B94|nr:hypothetical protein [Paenibacillus sp. RRE4]MDT0124893.1 hypothetical protein [Paenibacillus sp. RRE4]